MTPPDRPDAKAEIVCPKCYTPMPGRFRCVVIGSDGPHEELYYGPCPCDPDQRTIYIRKELPRGN